MIIDEEVYLEHFGVKGMKWGVRKKDSTPRTKEEQAKHERRQKQAKIILGSAAVTVAIGAGAYYAKKKFSVPTNTISDSAKKGTQFTKAIAEEPVSLMHTSRGKERGYMVLRGGKMKLPEEEFIKAGLDNGSHGYFKRYGDGLEKVAISFKDPEGRKDQSGRVVMHDVIFPAKDGKHLYNFDQAREEAWPMIKDMAGAYYDSKKGNYGPGF